MSRLPSAKADDLVRVVRKLGFVLDRQKGSHAIYLHPERPGRLVIPMHSGDLKRGTVRGMVADLGISVEEFLELL